MSSYAIWTTKIRKSDEFDSYLILSFTNGTLILSIGEAVEEVTDTGFLASIPTIAVQQLGQDAIIQIHPGGIRYIHADVKIVNWKAPAQKSTQQATTNQRQGAIALSSGELQEYQEQKQMTGAITALSIGPEG
ncbi:Pre-mRNA-splicing factor rse1 [Neolecta irregularis DAH-3]|uniref:Pre-mRNA-splicing factor rse1 n=1 Tax=Neolecta irregularis (strain DAH-3) TaxID=1198029 RepID=A0A1U7LS25_NEOID|nr:Pre-mRNA-splicing factor rse1 [Neolecta irregularis DAH-3]|eukprot:OLL25429.1 Pre-mRNA-splicing factor rse1 [Neolecta irregularis DAH-3]